MVSFICQWYTGKIIAQLGNVPPSLLCAQRSEVSVNEDNNSNGGQQAITWVLVEIVKVANHHNRLLPSKINN